MSWKTVTLAGPDWEIELPEDGTTVRMDLKLAFYKGDKSCATFTIRVPACPAWDELLQRLNVETPITLLLGDPPLCEPITCYCQHQHFDSRSTHHKLILQR